VFSFYMVCLKNILEKWVENSFKIKKLKKT
jgi:hypothetical protein